MRQRRYNNLKWLMESSEQEIAEAYDCETPEELIEEVVARYYYSSPRFYSRHNNRATESFRVKNRPMYEHLARNIICYRAISPLSNLRQLPNGEDLVLHEELTPEEQRRRDRTNYYER